MTVIRGFKYSPQTGMIYRYTCNPQHRKFNGPVRRRPLKDGYPKVSYQNQNYRQHTFIYKLLGIDRPEDHVIDHINGNRKDNRWVNLRLVPQLVNARNQKRHRQGSVPGVFWHKTHQKWVGRIYVHQSRKYLGYFATKEEAIDAVRKATEYYEKQKEKGE